MPKTAWIGWCVVVVLVSLTACAITYCLNEFPPQEASIGRHQYFAGWVVTYGENDEFGRMAKSFLSDGKLSVYEYKKARAWVEKHLKERFRNMVNSPSPPAADE